MGAVTTLRNEVLNKILRGENFTTQATHLSLHTASPGSTGDNEVVGGSYARQAIEFNTASGGSSVNTNTETFSDLPAATITHVGLWTAVSGGSFVWGGSLSVTKEVGAGDSLEFPPASITVPTSGA